MAYNSGYNPDELPAHAEPEQAAAMLSGQPNPPPPGGRPQPNPKPQSYQPRASSFSNSRPQPPLPSHSPPVNQHVPGAYNNNTSYGGDPYSNAAPGPQQGQAYRNYGQSPPPPANYGMGPPPMQYHGRSPPVSRPPPTPAPGSQVGRGRQGSGQEDGELLALFRAVDKDQSGQLTESELRSALVNGDWTSFDPHTVRMMIRMFATDKSGTINYDEFCGLWGFLASWRSLFDRFDEDGSGNISFDEYSKALVAFGYRLTPTFVSVLFKTYDKRGENAISFDLFVQSCISLKRMTDVFKKYDDDRDGYITLSFEEFLTEILRQR